MSYHITPRFQAYENSSHMYFATRGALSRHVHSDEVSNAVSRCHTIVLAKARPVLLSTLLPQFMREDPELTLRIMDQVREFGVMDELMVPVFGPYTVNGVISFGFEGDAARIPARDRFCIEGFCTSLHQRLVHCYLHSHRVRDLSDREMDVLRWIARGKTRSEISTILDLQPSSVDTYTRRIFKKLGANDRVTASMNAIFEGVLTP